MNYLSIPHTENKIDKEKNKTTGSNRGNFYLISSRFFHRHLNLHPVVKYVIALKMDRKSMDRKSADKGLTFITLLYDTDPAGGACHQNRYVECLGVVGAGTASTWHW